MEQSERTNLGQFRFRSNSVNIRMLNLGRLRSIRLRLGTAL
jgi:hypothetical protein